MHSDHVRRLVLCAIAASYVVASTQSIRATASTVKPVNCNDGVPCPCVPYDQEPEADLDCIPNASPADIPSDDPTVPPDNPLPPPQPDPEDTPNPQ